jgi:hypothetical protein
MSVIRWSSFSVLVAVTLACSNGIAAPPVGFTHAAAVAACGPTDGPAIAIYLSPNPVESPQVNPPVVRIYINQAVEQVGGQAWRVGAGAETLASFQSAGNISENAKSGYVITNSVSADKTIEGTVNLTFPSAGHIGGSFHAEWISQAGPLCG